MKQRLLYSSFPLLFLVLLFITSCSKKQETLFKLLPSEQTGVDFNNFIEETDSFNILTYEYIYNGGGVGIADFNNDSKPDIFFTGNQVANKLYLNQGEFKFKDITDKANVNIAGRWNSGVSIVDINNDGWIDLYVCATTNPNPDDRRNMLFVNQGVDKSGVPTFKEMAADYKIDFDGHSISSAFFDYDKDGDLDLYILVNVKLDNVPTNFREKIIDGTSANNDRLFRNEGNGTFKDVTIEAGIVYEGFGLGLAVTDFNNDDWPDLYVSNDYLSNDILYINQKDGTFKNSTAQFMGHQSQFSMGNDAADINNDGLSDLITLDMLPENSERKKTTIGNKSYQTYINNESFKYQYQYVRNMLQLNNGSKDEIKFSEVGQLAGVHQTEWSWSPLFVDFDNDGFRDLAITNGFPKDITDKDFANYRSALMNLASPGFLVDSIPVVKISNYAFKNNGDLTFQDVTKVWGLSEPSFSNGAAFADLDSDGDLDYVVNNINATAFVYENTLYSKSNDAKKTTANFLRVKLQGSEHNVMGIGAKVSVFYDSGKIQYHDHSIYRGYLSSVEGVIHFGLGLIDKVDSLIVQWPDGKIQSQLHVKLNTVLVVDYKNAKQGSSTKLTDVPSYFSEVSKQEGIFFKHAQNDVIDFNIQRTIPHKYSQFGPALTVGDIDGDSLEDFFVGGSPGYTGQFFLQQKESGFKRESNRLTNATKQLVEDTGALLVDFDVDGDLDLYVVRGGFEWEKDSPNYQDILYVNDGKGFFTLSTGLLPTLTSSGACVRAADFDADGDLDLFVGGRVVPGRYPYAPESYILRNENGKFVNATATLCPQVKEIGMVTDAVWSDVDNDGKIDLMVVGELMSIQFLKNNGRSFDKISTSLDQFKGWWNSIAASDFDRDGDVDFVIGNLGRNNFYNVSSQRSVKVFAKDLDNNGSVEAITACYSKMLDGSEQLCPIHFWDELNQQSPKFRRQFSSYKQFSKATMETLLSKKDLEGALILEGNYSSSSYVENEGGGKFKITPLPVLAQVAPVNGLVANDVNEDGNVDVVMIGNDYGNEVFIGRYDAFTGLVLLGNGKGNFVAVPSSKSGFYVPNDAKALVRLSGKNQDLIIASQNRDSLQVFKATRPQHAQVFNPEPLDVYATLLFTDGRKQKIEFYYGAGYLSQSTRKINIPKGVSEIVVTDSKGKSRKVKPVL